MQKDVNPLAPYEKQFDVATRKLMVSEMLCELRKAKGIPQKEVAKILGISPQTYNGYERGRNEPPIEILVRISFLYEVPIDALVQRDRFHAYDQSAMETVKVMEDELTTLRKELARNPMAENEQVKALMGLMEQLVDLNKQIVEKHSL